MNQSIRLTSLMLVALVSIAMSGHLAGAETERPKPVSPGSLAVAEPVATSCPTFSWTSVEGSLGYKLVTYHLAVDGGLEPQVEVDLPAGASSWTPAAAQCPRVASTTGKSEYAWAVRALTDDGAGPWSELLLFTTPGAPTEDEVRQALAVLRRYQSTESVGAGLAPAPRSDDDPAAPRQTREDARSSPTRSPADRAMAAPTLGAGPSPQVITPPASFSLNLTGDVNLGGALFRNGQAFVHSDADPTRRNSAVGIEALTKVVPVPGYEDITGIDNTALGYQALRENTFARHNTAVGAYALTETAGGSFNTAVGSGALALNTGGSSNVAVGRMALSGNQVGSGNVAVGVEALSSNTAGGNVAVGEVAMRDNIDGVNNVAVGSQALNENSSGQGNAAVGAYAIRNNLTGSFNTALGWGAGGLWETGNNNIAIGRGADGTAGESGVIRIGGDDHQTQTFIEGISGTPLSGLAVVIDGDQLGVTASSARFKHDIRDLGSLSARLQDLRPVSFRYNEDGRAVGGEERLEYGLIAEEVAKVFPELIVNDAEGKPFTVRYQLLTPLLVAEVQRLQEEVWRQREQIERLRLVEEQLAALRRQVDRQARKAGRSRHER